MKKFLLLCCAAMASLSIHAQQTIAPQAGIQLQGLMPITLEKAEPVLVKAPESRTALPKLHAFKPAKAQATADEVAEIVGTYIELLPRYDGLTLCDSLTIAPYSFTDEDGNTYNVELSFSGGDVQNVVGNYDSETHVITIPAQYCYYFTAYDAYCSLYGWDNGAFTDGIHLEFDPATKSLKMQEQNYYVYIVDGDLMGYVFGNKGDHGMTALRQTHTFTWATQGLSVDGTYSSFYKLTDACAVEETDDCYKVYGAFNLERVNLAGCVLTIGKNADGSLSMATKQNAWSLIDIVGASNLDSSKYGEYIYIWGSTQSGSNINVNQNVTEYKGTFVDNCIYFSNYYPTLSNVSAGSGYGWWNQGVLIEPLSGTNGIGGITDNATMQPATGLTYNLQGQPVGPSYKGIVVKGGKKMLQK